MTPYALTITSYLRAAHQPLACRRASPLTTITRGLRRHLYTAAANRTGASPPRPASPRSPAPTSPATFLIHAMSRVLCEGNTGGVT